MKDEEFLKGYAFLFGRANLVSSRSQCVVINAAQQARSPSCIVKIFTHARIPRKQSIAANERMVRSKDKIKKRKKNKKLFYVLQS